MNLNKVAILIPSMNRIEFLIRTLSYYKSINSIHPIIIGDASEKNSSHLIDNYKEFLNVNYYHLPNLNVSKTITKLANIANELNFKFCVIQGDDDFLIPDSLQKCSDFLKNNNEYSCAQGDAVSIELNKIGPYGKIKSISINGQENHNEFKTPIERFKFFLENYYVTQFSVHRTSEFVESCKYYENFLDVNFGEIYHCVCFAIQGKSKYIEGLHLVRNLHSKIYHPEYLDWILSYNWSNSFEEIIDHTTFLLRDSNISKKEVKDLYLQYLKLTAQRKIYFNSGLTFFLRKYVKSVLDFFPNMKTLFKYIYIKFLPNDHLLKIFNRKSIYFKQAQPILNIILKNV